MRISDWSSDVCSSDLINRVAPFVDRPVQVGPFAPHLYVGLIQTPARIKAAPPEPAETLLHLRRVALHPAIDRRMIDIDPTLGQHFLEITVADAVSTIPEIGRAHV